LYTKCIIVGNAGNAAGKPSAELSILDIEGKKSMAYPATCPSGSPITLTCETALIDPSQRLTVWFRAYAEGEEEPQRLVSY